MKSIPKLEIHASDDSRASIFMASLVPYTFGSRAANTEDSETQCFILYEGINE